MSGIKVDFSNAKVKIEDIMEYENEVKRIHKDLHEKANDEKDFVGWLELPTNYDKQEFERIKKAARKNTKKFRNIFMHWNRWFIFRSKSSNRSTNPYIL